MKVISHLNNKGQLTLPKTMRDILGVGENQCVELYLDTKKREVVIRNPNQKEDTLNLLHFLIKNQNLVILIQGKAGSGKTELIKALTDGKTYKGSEKLVSKMNFLFIEDGDVCVYDGYSLKEIEEFDIPKEQTFISLQEYVNIQKNDYFKKLNRPILEVNLNGDCVASVMSIIVHENNNSIKIL